MLTKTTLTALSAILALGFVVEGQSVMAQTADTVSVTVPYGDLNLSTTAGARVMLRRINNAAEQICGPEPTNGIERMTTFQPCVKSITSDAVARLGNVAVAELNGSAGAPSIETLASTR